MAPELWNSKSFDGRQADVFSMGVLIFNMLVGRFPFDKATSKDPWYSHMMKNNKDEFWK